MDTEDRPRQGGGTLELTIRYPEDLLLSLKETPAQFEAQAKLLLAVKLYETGKVSSSLAARLAGLNRVDFLFELSRFGVSPIDIDAAELATDAANA
jgi:predicted HTH domain antitoxin